MTRALLMPLAHSSTLKPDGTLILSTGISPGAFGAGGWAMGGSGELSISLGWPRFPDRGACGAANRAVARTNATTTASGRAYPYAPRLLGGACGAATIGCVGLRP